MLREVNNISSHTALLATFAQFVCAETIVEIGVLGGETAKSLINIAKMNNGMYYGYDFFDAIGIYPKQYSQYDIENMLINQGFDNHDFKLTKIDTGTEEFSKILMEDTKGKIDFAFIDGDHSYFGVKRDFENIYKLLSEDGVIALHDTYSHVGCRKLVTELYTIYNDGTYDIINLPYGGNNIDRYGLTFLVKRSYPLYKFGIHNEQHEKYGLKSNEVYEEEEKWYLKQIQNKH